MLVAELDAQDAEHRRLASRDGRFYLSVFVAIIWGERVWYQTNPNSGRALSTLGERTMSIRGMHRRIELAVVSA